MEAELGVMHPQAKNSFPWSLWRELGPGTSGPQTSGLQDWGWGTRIPGDFRPPSSWSLVKAAKGNVHPPTTIPCSWRGVGLSFSLEKYIFWC